MNLSKVCKNVLFGKKLVSKCNLRSMDGINVCVHVAEQDIINFKRGDLILANQIPYQPTKDYRTSTNSSALMLIDALDAKRNCVTLSIKHP